ncbi:MAG TPA: hypothetical protein VKU41_26115 [Polyangiaceae bacterium]|nr:hypothetical protein [Polyangiaceae bacterium]
MNALAATVPTAIETPSLVVDVAFGEAHDEALERERKRTREVQGAMSGGSGRPR